MKFRVTDRGNTECVASTGEGAGMSRITEYDADCECDDCLFTETDNEFENGTLPELEA